MGDSDAEIAARARQALAAWSQFTVSRNLRLVEELFTAGGPRLQAFSDQARSGPSPTGVGYGFTMPVAQVLRVGDSERILRGDVVATSTDGHVQRFPWDITLRRDVDGSWRVWSVRRTPPV